MHQTKKEIRDFLERHDISIVDASSRLTFNSRQALHQWLRSDRQCRQLEILEAFQQLKKEYGE